MTSAESSSALTSLIEGYRRADLIPVLLRELAHGEPLDRARVAALAGVSEDALDDVLRDLPTGQWDQRQRLIGLGITFVPTPHRFVVDSRTLYTWCATDTLIFPAVIGRSARVESVCPATGARIAIEVHPGSLGRCRPHSAVVTRALPRTAVADLRVVGCALGHFYAFRAAAEPWRAAHPDGFVLTVEEEFRAGIKSVARLGWSHDNAD